MWSFQWNRCVFSEEGSELEGEATFFFLKNRCQCQWCGRCDFTSLIFLFCKKKSSKTIVCSRVRVCCFVSFPSISCGMCFRLVFVSTFFRAKSLSSSLEEDFPRTSQIAFLSCADSSPPSQFTMTAASSIVAPSVRAAQLHFGTFACNVLFFPKTTRPHLKICTDPSFGKVRRCCQPARVSATNCHVHCGSWVIFFLS